MEPSSTAKLGAFSLRLPTRETVEVVVVRLDDGRRIVRTPEELERTPVLTNGGANGGATTTR
jgi:hypothetical protein